MDKKEIQNLIKELVEKTTVLVNNISIDESNPKTTLFLVEVDLPHFFTGRNGEGLFALNHLMRKVIETKFLKEGGEIGALPEIMVDINGFQKKKIENIRAVAHMMAERARYFKSNIEVDPMSAFERRVIHEFLSDATDLKTESTGVGPARRVVIKYLGNI